MHPQGMAIHQVHYPPKIILLLSLAVTSRSHLVCQWSSTTSGPVVMIHIVFTFMELLQSGLAIIQGPLVISMSTVVTLPAGRPSIMMDLTIPVRAGGEQGDTMALHHLRTATSIVMLCTLAPVAPPMDTDMEIVQCPTPDIIIITTTPSTHRIGVEAIVLGVLNTLWQNQC
jgi:hypothetical protein